MDLCPRPSEVRAPDGGAPPSVSGSGAWIPARDLFFFLLIWLRRVREFVRDCARLRVPLRERMPPGEGREAMCEIEAEVCSSEVVGS
jgi:hypothetical protein